MALELSLSSDCKTLTISGGTANADVELHLNNVICPMVAPPGTINPVTGLTNSSAVDEDIEILDGTGGLVLTNVNIPCSSTEQLNGVIKVVVTEPSGNVTLGALGLCALECCLSKKVKELLDCKCKDCIECTSLLNDVTLIYLFMQGMQVNIAGCVQTTALYTKTADEYNKAVELCGIENCNCNC